MQNRGHALARDELVRVLTAYTGITTAIGGVGGTTIVDTNLINNPLIVPAAIPEKTILIASGPAAGEDKGAASFNNVTGAVTLQGTGFSVQIPAGTIYRILNISSIEVDVAAIDTKIGTNVDPAGTTTLFAYLKGIITTVVGASTEATYSLPNDVAENSAFIITAAQQRIFLMLDLSNLVQNATIRIRYDIHGDGAPFPIMETFNWTVGMDDIVYFREISGQRAVQVTVQSAIAQGAAVDIDHEYVLG